MTTNYSGGNKREIEKGKVIAVYSPPAGMGDWTIDIHIPKNAVSIQQLQAETRYGSGGNYGTGAGNLCWKLVEIADAEYLNQSIFGAGFTGHVYYESIQAVRGRVQIAEAQGVFEQAAGSTGHRQHRLAFCLEDRIATMLREACLRGDIASAFAIMYDLAGQTHYKVPEEYTFVKGKNVFYGPKEKADIIFGAYGQDAV